MTAALKLTLEAHDSWHGVVASYRNDAGRWFLWCAFKWSCIAFGAEIIKQGMLIYAGPFILGIGLDRRTKP